MNLTNIELRKTEFVPFVMAVLLITALLLSIARPARAGAQKFPATRPPGCGFPGLPACPPVPRSACGAPFFPPCPTPLCGTPGTAPCPSTLSDTYFNVTNGDNIVSLINPATTGSTDVCAMIYVFDDDEEMTECCGCPLSPQMLLTLSVDNNLNNNPTDTQLFGGRQSGPIEAVSAAPNPHLQGSAGINNGSGCSVGQSGACNDGCDPTQNPGYNPSQQVKGYIAHYAGTVNVSFNTASDPDPTTLTYLEEECGSLVGNESGSGICSCEPKLPPPGQSP